MKITDNSYHFAGLAPDNSYTITVAGRNNIGVGESSSVAMTIAGNQNYAYKTENYDFVQC